MRPLSSLSQKVLRKPAKIRGFAEFSVLEKWAEIFPSYAKYMRPISLRKGVMKVATNSGSAASNLRMQGDYLLARINQYFGYNAVKSIQFSIREFDALDKISITLLEEDAESISYAKGCCASIDDDSLRNSFERLASLIHQEKKLRK